MSLLKLKKTEEATQELTKEKAVEQLTALAMGYDIMREEKRRKKKRILLISAMCFFLLTTLVFTSLFFLNLHRKEEICGERYIESLDRTVILITKCIDDDFDFETKFREINAELGNARGMLFEANSTQEQRTTITDLYYLAIKLPDQFKLYISDIRNALVYISAGDDDKGYALIDQVISKSDKLDYGDNNAISEQVEGQQQSE